MQVQRLEAVLGEQVLIRGKGGSVQITRHGQYLLDRARDLLALNDEIWTAFHAPDIHGTVRLGTPDDYALSHLPAVLRRFAEHHPAVDVDVLCAPSHEIVELLEAGALDLALCTSGNEKQDWPVRELWRGPLRWVTSERHSPHRIDPLPLALAADRCSWRRSALEALRAAGRRYRVAYTSTTLAGTHAPVVAGLAVTVSPITFLPPGLRALPPSEELPPLADTAILLLLARKPRQPLTDALAAHLAGQFAGQFSGQFSGQLAGSQAA